MISKNSFFEKQINNGWIHEYITFDGVDWRLYNTKLYDCKDIFWNEVGFFFLNMLNKNIQIYYLKSSPKHNIIYNDDCLNFFKFFKKNRDYLIIPENLKKLRELQSGDLMFFYKHLILESFFLISKFKNNLYHYDMILMVKNDFNVSDFLKINFNTINIESISPIFNENINYNSIKSIFNFDDLEKYNFDFIKDGRYHKMSSEFFHRQLKEYKVFEEYKKNQIKNKNVSEGWLQKNDPLYWNYFNEYAGAGSEISNQQKLFEEYYFPNFGFQWSTLNYEFSDCYNLEPTKYTYPINEPFLLTYDNIPKHSATLKSDGSIELFDREYSSGCMFDLIFSLIDCDSFVWNNIISVPKILYNTSYKIRLKK